MVRFQSISKSFGDKPVVRDFSLSIESGERFTLLGRSGCGKTTLLRLIAGFEQPDTGRIFIGGEEVTHLPVEQRPVGFIFQNYALFPHMTVYDNIAVGQRIRNVPEDTIARRIGDLLEITHLKGLQNAYPGRLSGGEAQRVAIARAIINEPKILLLDEPLSALDASLRQSLREELVDMQKTLGLTFLFVTHDQEEAMSLATRMSIMEEGRLLQVGPPEELYHRPGTPYVAKFLGEINRLSAVVESIDGPRVTLELEGGVRLQCETSAALQVGDRVVCFIRPENMSFTEEQSPGPDRILLEGTISGSAFFGSYTRYTVTLDNGESIHIPVSHGAGESPESAAPKNGRARIVFAIEDVNLFPAELH